MLFKSIIAPATALLFAGQAFAGAVEAGNQMQERTAQIATDPVSACNCPNNCSHKSGSSCKYYSGPSDSSPIDSGKCAWRGSTLICVV
ncbi:hypothetical protein CONLIGDRAFT_626667 [Coniochaeta ligniaria NRRL 30616]|uniref:Uncharacterized protein n=1 Tax=Coniochaeta ligniaria NRRL 30616 TaxID=1408157 RepID=A0A1J7JYZ5_9PEZI|nr:hypothetical protein CONLIGDRAFT_626667 [Coniochaeta ligniaria NRRL 30616]